MSLDKTIKSVVTEIFQADRSNLVDKKGQKIITNKLVRLENKRGQIKGVTVEAKVKVTWFFPEEIAGTSTAEDPKSLESY